MKLLAIIAVTFGALSGAPAFAQAPPGPGGPADGPPPEVRQRIDQARSGARIQAMTGLTSDHQAKVNAVLTRVKAAQLTDVHDAAQQIDAILTRKEATAVLAAREKLMADLRDARDTSDGPRDGGPGGPPPADFGPGRPGPGAGFAPGGRRLAGRAMHDDAGLALLMLNLDHEQMRALFEHNRPAQ